jgi:glyoxylase-like metal-dependent hydrolase (beta-lactamase superfamily II)
MEEQADRMAELFTRNGTPEDIVKQVREFFVLQSRDTLPLPERISDMHAGDRIQLGGASYEVVPVPGHADGMVGFWDAASRVFIAADSILPHITPNVGIWPKCSDNPLADYFATLRKIVALNPALTLPGHGEPMENTVERAEAIIAHHHDRLNAFEKSVEQGLTTAYAIANEHFRLGRLSPHQTRFAIAEAHAHLEYLVSVGRLSKTGEEVHHYAKKVREG